jgi:hypothetical protein
VDVEAELPQTVCYYTAGAVFLEAELGMHVKVSPQRDHVVDEIFG